jgi:2-iminoacetate synthase
VSEPPGAFAAMLGALDTAALSAHAATATDAEVTAALRRDRIDLLDLAVLLSPAASSRLEEIAGRAWEITRQRFGRVIRLFAPLYLSNHCLASCTYCGFARNLAVTRTTLPPVQVEAEARVLADCGFRHLLLVAGEHRVEVSPEYLLECVHRLRPFIPSISIETQTWADDTYARLVRAGLEGVVHYQETYDRARYRQVHPAGWKRDFDRRLNAVERAGQAGARRLGIGALLGLAADWRADLIALAAHARFLSRRYLGSETTVSLPRINPSASGYQPVAVLSDAQYVQAIAALRLFEPTAGIVLSTREPAVLRDGLVRIAVTHLSAGSSTEPGGYRTPGQSQEQFSLADHRSPREVAEMIAAAGYQPEFQDAFPLYRVREPVAGAATATNAFALLRPPPGSDRDQDAQILA